MTSAEPRITALDAGTYYHHRSLHTPDWAACIDRIAYIRELDDQVFEQSDAFVVSCRTHPELLIAHRERFARFLAQGKTLVAMGETAPQRWLDHVQWTSCPVNFWWWKEPDPDSGLRLASPQHPLLDYITLADATWHQHGSFTVPPGAVSLIDKVGAGSVLYEDCVSTAGRLIVTSLDPMYHHGSYFMPATTRFLRGFFPWLRDSTRALMHR